MILFLMRDMDGFHLARRCRRDHPAAFSSRPSSFRARRALWPCKALSPKLSASKVDQTSVTFPRKPLANFPFAGVLARADPMRGHRTNNLEVHEANPLTQALRRAHKAGFRQSRRKIGIPRLRQTDKPFRPPYIDRPFENRPPTSLFKIRFILLIVEQPDSRLPYLEL